MPNSPNAAKAMTDPATCHAHLNFLLWDSPIHSSTMLNSTATHGKMLITGLAAGSNHFKMFKSNITLYHFVSRSWQIPESPNWVAGPAPGCAEEAAPQLAKSEKRCVQIWRFLRPLRHATNDDNVPRECYSSCDFADFLSMSLPWSSDFGHQPRDPLTTGGWSALHSQPLYLWELNHSQVCMSCSKKTGIVRKIRGISRIIGSTYGTRSIPKVPSYSIHHFAMRMIRLKQPGSIWFNKGHHKALNGNLFWRDTQAASEARCLVGRWFAPVMNYWCFL